MTLQGWGWRHAGRKAWALRDVSFQIEAGERVLLLGASGSGKSTLLHALAGVLGDADEGEESGRLLVGGVRPGRGVGRLGGGLVLQDPESQVILSRVGDDVAFGPENLGLPREEIWSRTRDAISAVGLRVGLDHPTERLSGGEQQRLAVAGVLALRPGLLLLDEPTANLDPAGVREVRRAVGDLVADRRHTLIVVEHHLDVWLDLIDRVIVLGGANGVISDGNPASVFSTHGAALAGLGAWVPGHTPEVHRSASRPGETLLTADSLRAGYAESPATAPLELSVAEGTSTVITGPNGSGKTALTLTLGGLLAPRSGVVRAAPRLTPPGRGGSPQAWRSRELLSRIGTVFQEPEHQFVAGTVRDELGVGPAVLRSPASDTRRRVADLLESLHLDRLAQANPFTLSGGEKRRLSVGTALATRPALVLLDEPTFGQDSVTWADLVRLIDALVREGTAVVSATHDERYAALLGDRRLELTPLAADR